MRKLIVGVLLAVVSSIAFALPSLQDVEAAVKQGNYTQAETMMGEVVAARPDSAKAHYVYAEVLAHNGKFGEASTQAAAAKRIDPKIGFADPDKFRTFESLLQREQNATSNRSAVERSAPVSRTQAYQAPERSGIPSWVWLLVLVGIGIALWRGFAGRRGVPPAAGTTMSSQAPGGVPGGYPPPYPGAGPAYAPGAPAQGAASGLLRTGLAVAGGVAGGMLLDRALQRRDGSDATSSAGALGGLVPDSFAGTPHDNAATELENRAVDFGNGDDWGSSDGGSIDSGDSGGGWD